MTNCPRCQRTYDDGVRFCPVDGVLVVPSADPSIALNIGRVLYGQFELRELAGRGATGTVWRAYQKSMDRIVAVKILHTELAGDADIVKRFLREARAIAKIIHPNIVTVHMVGETDEGIPYLVMEHVDGISLETIVEAQGPQAVGRVVHLGRQIAMGLGEAHANGIIHRDLKPANLLVTDRARTADQVKILDFGIAKLLDPGKELSQITRGQQVFGTPHYMAPEQATGEAIDARTDLYAFGVVMFRLITGHVPFDAPAGMQVILRHLRDTPPRPSTLNPLIPAALEDLILACLAKSPGDRPKDTDDVIAALDEIVERSPTRERRAVGEPIPTPPPPPQPPSKSGKLLAPELAAREPTAPGSPAVSGMLSGPYPRPAPQRDRAGWMILVILALIGMGVYFVTRGGTRPAIAELQPDLATASSSADLALIIAATPDRDGPDLAIALATPPPDLAVPRKKRHHSDDDDANLPVTVFGAEPTPPPRAP